VRRNNKVLRKYFYNSSPILSKNDEQTLFVNRLRMGGRVRPNGGVIVLPLLS